VTDLVVTADAAWTGGDAVCGPVAVALDGQRITWIGAPSAAPSAPRRHVDGVLLPGLVDHHVHSGLIDCAALLRGGVTTVHDLGWIPDAIFPIAEASADAAFDGPRILAAGPFLTAPGGYPTKRDWAPDGIAWEVDDPSSAAAAVRSLAVHRPATIKIALNADAGPVLDDVTVTAVVVTAHELGFEVTAHAEGEGQVAKTVRAGVDQLAHVPWTEPLDDPLVDALARHVRVISTLDIHGWGERTGCGDTAVRNLGRFHERGGRVRYGTDLGNGPLPQGVNAREIAALGEAGLAPVDVLRAMTCDSLATGARADLVAIPEDPLGDPLRLARATTVVKAGVPPQRRA
jgi:imidazolonepropionase-like amidohydrolase